jgi:hypothetical protein
LSSAPGETIAFCCPTSKATSSCRLSNLYVPAHTIVQTTTARTQSAPAASFSTVKVYSRPKQPL